MVVRLLFSICQQVDEGGPSLNSSPVTQRQLQKEKTILFVEYIYFTVFAQLQTACLLLKSYCNLKSINT